MENTENTIFKKESNIKSSLILKSCLVLLLFISGGLALYNAFNIINYLAFDSPEITKYTDTTEFKGIYYKYTDAVVKYIEQIESDYISKENSQTIINNKFINSNITEESQAYDDDNLIQNDIPKNNRSNTDDESIQNDILDINQAYTDDEFIQNDIPDIDQSYINGEFTQKNIFEDNQDYIYEDSTQIFIMEDSNEQNNIYYTPAQTTNHYSQWLNKNNHSFFYYIKDNDTNEYYYNKEMNDYILSSLSLPDNYELTSDDLYMFFNDLNIHKNYLILDSSTQNIYTNINDELHSSYYYILHTAFNRLLNTKHNYTVYTFYTDYPDINEDFRILRSKFITLKLEYNSSIVPFFMSLSVFLLLLIALIPTLGHKKYNEGIYLSWYDRIPMEVIICIFFLPYFIILLVLFSLESYIYNNITHQFTDFTSLYQPLGFLYLFIFITSILLYITTIKRLKARTFINSFLCVKIFKYIYKLIVKLMKCTFKNIIEIINTIYNKYKSSYKKFKLIFKNFFLYRSTTFQIIIILSVFTLYEAIFILYTINNDPSGFFFILAGFIVLSYIMIRMGSDMNQMLYTTEKISDGNMHTTINTDDIIIPMKKLASQINSISTGLTAAVEDKLKSERLKTELITNVSHDIKTPLTSIITYVDLLQKEELNNEKASEYLAVLKEKSWRLKTLIEDLVEASKASTGNISMTFEKINLNELVKQSCGEFEDRFNEHNLNIILNLPEEPIVIFADGRSTYRIIENLLSNVTKYALPGTRVYIDSIIENKNAVFTIKNISADKLNISSDELMERFVRGDSSRNAEGNGLGLSIAKSLTDLLHGTFELFVDGDLFKVTIKIPLYTETLLPDFIL